MSNAFVPKEDTVIEEVEPTRKEVLAKKIAEAREAKKLAQEKELEEAKTAIHKSENATTSDEKTKEIVEKNVKNKITINPDMKESIVGKIYQMYNNKYLDEKATPESGTGKYYNEKKPTSQQLEKRAKMDKVKALTNAGKHQEASKLYKSTMKKEDVSNWRDDLREIVGTGGLGGDVEDTQSSKPNSEVVVKEKNVKNKVVIDPEVKLEQALGGKVIELKTVSEKMTTAALEDSPADCPECGEPVHEGACATAEEEKTVEESILWDRVAVSLTRLGEMSGKKFKVVPEAYKAVTNAPDSLAKMNKRYKPVKKIKNPTDRPFRDRLKDPDYKVDEG